jgi:Alpha-glutamyl/putrescinyl thymine pyrophosphorylase clade 3
VVTPTFCRHNRFIERCPICSKTLPWNADRPARSTRPQHASPSNMRAKAPAKGRAGGRRAGGVRVVRETRAEDDGYRSPLVPGIRASADADRLAAEIAFSDARLSLLEHDPPGLYGELAAVPDGEHARWGCFLAAYLSPLAADDADPFTGIRRALARPWQEGELSLDDLPLGPRSAHDRAFGAQTPIAYVRWFRHSGRDRAGSGRGAPQRAALDGDPDWSPPWRFSRLFERLALPGFARGARYEFLVTLGRLGLHALRADSLHLGDPAARSAAVSDPVLLAAKRIFAIGDTINLERRARRLADAAGVPIEVLDLALFNWSGVARATQGVPADIPVQAGLDAACAALGL